MVPQKGVIISIISQDKAGNIFLMSGAITIT